MQKGLVYWSLLTTQQIMASCYQSVKSCRQHQRQQQQLVEFRSNKFWVGIINSQSHINQVSKTGVSYSVTKQGPHLTAAIGLANQTSQLMTRPDKWLDLGSIKHSRFRLLCNDATKCTFTCRFTRRRRDPADSAVRANLSINRRQNADFLLFRQNQDCIAAKMMAIQVIK